MPSLQHLIQELRTIRVHPSQVFIPGQLYDNLIGQAEDIADTQNPIDEQQNPEDHD
jgi:hypothetical protein